MPERRFVTNPDESVDRVAINRFDTSGLTMPRIHVGTDNIPFSVPVDPDPFSGYMNSDNILLSFEEWRRTHIAPSIPRPIVYAIPETEEEKMDRFELFMETVLLKSCLICGNLHDTVGLDDVVVNNEVVPICTNCRRQYVSECRECGTTHLSTSGIYDSNGNFADDNCFANGLVICSRCGGFARDGELNEDEDSRMVCDSCAVQLREERERQRAEEERREANITIMDHSARPRNGWQKFGDGGKFGIFAGTELEVDNRYGSGGDARDCAKAVKDVFSSRTINKSDSSLNNGFEVVSHPMDEKEWESFDIEGLCKIISSHGLKSHETDTCGYHVHINRDAFGDSSSTRSDTIANLIIMVERDWTAIKRLSRRDIGALERWSNRYGLTTSPESYRSSAKDRAKQFIENGSRNDRYHAINLCNGETVEIRFWRGSLIPETIRGMLDITFAMAKSSIQQNGDTITLRDAVNSYCGKFGKRYWNERMGDNLEIEVNTEIPSNPASPVEV